MTQVASPSSAPEPASAAPAAPVTLATLVTYTDSGLYGTSDQSDAPLSEHMLNVELIPPNSGVDAATFDASLSAFAAQVAVLDATLNSTAVVIPADAGPSALTAAVAASGYDVTIAHTPRGVLLRAAPPNSTSSLQLLNLVVIANGESVSAADFDTALTAAATQFSAFVANMTAAGQPATAAAAPTSLAGVAAAASAAAPAS